MKKAFMVSMLLSCLLSGCTSSVTQLNIQFSGREVYICKNSYGITPGRRVIKEIVPFNINAKQYNVHLSNNSGSDDRIVWTPDTSNYIKDMENDLTLSPYCTREGFEKYQEMVEQSTQKRREKQAADEARRKELLADCKQAVDKAKNRRSEINSVAGELIILDETITSSPKNRTSNWSFCLKVVDYDNDGIIVKSNCTFSPVANLLLEAFIGCENKNYFIYTTDKYADGECYKDWEYLHKDMGVYFWSWNRANIRSYKKTNYKVSEIEHKTYLNNKSLKCCKDENSGTIKICD